MDSFLILIVKKVSTKRMIIHAFEVSICNCKFNRGRGYHDPLFSESESSTTPPVRKLQRIRRQDETEWLVYCESNTLYIQVRKNRDVCNLKPSQKDYNMVGKVVDFEFLSQGMPVLCIDESNKKL